MSNFISYILDTSGFPPRWNCGAWTAGEGWLHILSDLGVWSAYFAIPCVLGYYLQRRKDLPFRGIFLLFLAFILACGTTHLMEALIFWWPAYRLAGVFKLLTALVSWTTVFALVSVMPKAMRMRSPDDLEREIEQRQRVEESLREEQERFTKIADIAPGAILTYLLRPDGSVCFPYVSPVFTQIFGLRPKDLAEDGSIFMARIHSEDMDRILKAIADSARALLQWNHEYRWLHPEKGEIWVEGRTTPTREPDGGVLWHGFITDITDRKRAEAALRASEERLRAVVNTAVDAIITIDENGVIDSVNPAAERMFGYSAAEIVGHRFKSLLPSPYREEHEVYLARYLQSGERIKGSNREVQGQGKGGDIFPVELAVAEFADQGRRKFTKFLRDIRARKRLELQVLEIATIEQRRIGQELHDTTGQELTALCLLAETLVETATGRTPAQIIIATKIVEGLQRALGQIRSVARGLIPVEVGARGLQASLEELAARTNELNVATCTLDYGGRQLEIPDNQTATQIFHIVQEAVTNALRHSKASQILLSLIENDRTLTLQIQDDGIGFLPERLESEGMGLKIMHYRAGLIHGRLAIVSREPVGTTVTCTIFKGASHDQKHEPRE